MAGPSKALPAMPPEELLTALGSTEVVDRVAFGYGTQYTRPVRGRPDRWAVRRELENAAGSSLLETRGRVHRLKDGRIGRFGWKAQVASLGGLRPDRLRQRAGPGGPRPPSGRLPAGARRAGQGAGPHGQGVRRPGRLRPELASPRRRLDPSDAQGAADVAEGRRLFHSVGCASCHTADLGSIRGIYSDLLLHDMGEELSDSGSLLR